MKKIILITLSCIFSTSLLAQTDTTLVKKHLFNITRTKGYRNYKNTEVLNKIADYIYTNFKKYADTTYYQEYKVNGTTYKNVICRFGSNIKKPIIVVGAHYDVCGDQEGADDNASGVTALLELSRMLKGKKLSRPIEIVAYTLEEPPFFRTPNMGSNIHAQYLKKNNIDVYGMVAVEMIGYFNDEKGSQDYPVKAMKVVYGNKGNFILLVKKSGYGEFVSNFSAQFNNADNLEVKNIKAPAKIQGIDFSDHRNYWNLGYDALMVTNTAFYRNKNYHQKTDKMETLNIPKMSKVIDAIHHAVLNTDNVIQSNKKFSKK